MIQLSGLERAMSDVTSNVVIGSPTCPTRIGPRPAVWEYPQTPKTVHLAVAGSPFDGPASPAHAVPQA